MKTYTTKSNALRAARAAGILNPVATRLESGRWLAATTKKSTVKNVGQLTREITAANAGKMKQKEIVQLVIAAGVTPGSASAYVSWFIKGHDAKYNEMVAG
jgi:hypothetical protein